MIHKLKDNLLDIRHGTAKHNLIITEVNKHRTIC